MHQTARLSSLASRPFPNPNYNERRIAMRFSRSVLLFAMLFCLLGVVSAQQPQGDAAREISRVYYLTPKAGSEMQFEKALQEHAQLHAQRKDPWRWNVRLTETGRRTGEYIVITSGHQWKDFDNPAIPNIEDDQHFGSTVGPHVGSWSSVFLQSRPDLSRMQQMTPNSPLMVVTFFYLKYGKTAQFEDAIKQINTALDKTGAPRMSTWSQMVGSGRNATYLLVTPREN